MSLSNEKTESRKTVHRAPAYNFGRGPVQA
jgi:hypothetical protein